MNETTLPFTSQKDIEQAAMFLSTLRFNGTEFEANVDYGIHPGERMMTVTLK